MNKICEKCKHEIPEGSDHSCWDIGNMVICDSCNADFTESDETGGAVVGSNGYCPKCWPETLKRLQQYGETRYITAICPPDIPHREFILRMRGGDNTIRFDTGEAAMPWNKPKK